MCQASVQSSNSYSPLQGNLAILVELTSLCYYKKC